MDFIITCIEHISVSGELRNMFYYLTPDNNTVNKVRENLESLSLFKNERKNRNCEKLWNWLKRTQKMWVPLVITNLTLIFSVN